MHRRIDSKGHSPRSFVSFVSFTLTAAGLTALIGVHPAAAQVTIAFDQASNYTSGNGAASQVTTLNGGTGFSSAFREAVNNGGYFVGDAQGNGNGGTTATTINSANGTSFGIYGGGSNGEALQRTLNRPLIANSAFSFGFDNGFIDSGFVDQFAIGSAANNNLITFSFLGGGQNYLVNGADTGIGYTQNGLNVAVKFSSATAYTLSFYTLDNPTNVKTVAGTVAAGSTLNTITVSNNQTHGGPQYDLFVNNLQETAPEPTSLAGMLAGAGALCLPLARRRRRAATGAAASHGLR